VGILLLGIGIGLFITSAIINQTFAAKIVSMVTASHIGGGLPFIAVGLENGFSPSFIIPLVIFYNATYVLLIVSFQLNLDHS
jgi:hypothetical protein